MKSLSRVGLGLTVVFGCLFLALIAELYYLLWWKKKITQGGDEEEDSCHGGTGRELLCCKMASSSSISAQQFCTTNTLVHEPQAHRHRLHVYPNFKPFPEDLSTVEAEIRRLQHNFAGPPRFLFTITEETREDMDSEDDRQSAKKTRGRSRSLSDLVEIVETPYLTPLANSSPQYFTPPLTPTHNQKEGFDPFCELNGSLRSSSSPSPKFKFLKNDESKLQKREVNMNNEYVKVEVPSSSMFVKDEENGAFITLIVGQNKQEEETNGVNTTSQVFRSRQ